MHVNITRRTVTSNVEFPDGMHPVLKRVYAARNINSVDDLDYGLDRLHPFKKLSGIDKAVDVLVDVLESQKKILIVADFDADGATSCALAMRGLHAMGAAHVHYVVPNRFEFGYGLSPEIVRVSADHEPDVILTVDNGIASIEGVTLARSMGIDVVITDHHLPGNMLPPANAIVNPNLPGDSFPSKHLAGVGVMFYILIALRSALRERDWFAKNRIKEPNLAAFLDLVALGTVADVVMLDHNNRILVAQGLARMRSQRCCPGISALLKAANRNPRLLTAQDLSFFVAPRLNAAGRLTDMSLGIECLLADDMDAADQMARQLDELNRERKTIQEEMQEQALQELEQVTLDNSTSMPAGVCLFNGNWHQGVVGILASRIKDRLHRPVIAFARDQDGMVKGSARSIPGIHIRDVLDTIANRHPEIISKFGGHAMAAGLTLAEQHLETFRSLFADTVQDFLPDDDLHQHYLSDGPLNDNEISFELANSIRVSGPWGQGFPEPQFDGTFEIVSCKVVGEKHLKMQLRQASESRVIEAIAFNQEEADWCDPNNRIEVIYRLDINEFAGRKTLQLVIENLQPEPALR